MPQTNAIYNLSAIETSTEQIPVVGYTVLWRLHGLRVKHDQLKDALDRAGLRKTDAGSTACLPTVAATSTGAKPEKRRISAAARAITRSTWHGKTIISTRDSGCC
jgi:hypothetical protein